jgi:radical SAM superfamily enzyme YgiQ (UPF0313 family)
MEKWKVIEYYRDIVKKEGIKPTNGKIKIALIYPNRYEIASQNLGYQFVYKTFNDTYGLSCERFVLDFYEDNLSIETQKFLTDFDIIAISINYEEDVLNLVKFLYLQNIPVFRNERGNDFPPIIAGGALTLINPQILIDIVDIQLCGDFKPIFEKTREIFVNFEDKRSFLKSLAEFDFSIYYGQKRKAVPAIDYSKEPIFSSVKSCKGEFSSLFLVEASKSCKFNCRFCTTGYNLRPYRKIEIENIKSVILENSFSKEIGIISAAFGDISNLSNLLDWFIENHYKISVSSLRIDSLKEEFIEKLKLLGVRSITIAEEVASERLKLLISKNIAKEQLYNVVDLIAKSGIENLKLYYIFCLPSETVDDVRMIVERVAKIGDIFRKTQKEFYNRLGKIKVSVNIFNPKPFTPMQYFPLVDQKVYNDKAKILMDLKKIPNLKFDIMPYTNALIQSLIAKAEENISDYYKNYIDSGFNQKKALKNFDYSYLFKIKDEYIWEKLLDPHISSKLIRREYERCLQHTKVFY